MAIVVKSPEEIDKIRKSCRIVATVLEEMKAHIQPGVSTLRLDKIAEEIIRSYGATPSFKNYHGFTGSICASIDDCVIHGIPSSKMVLKEGQIISIDVGAYLDGFHGDAARTYAVGEISDEAKNMIEAAEKSFWAGMEYAKEGNHLHQISGAIEKTARSYGCSVIRDYVGHGVGALLHEDPAIPNYKPIGRGPKLVAGMTLAIEPMLAAGNWAVEVLDDGWTTVSRDGSLTSHYENTIAITPTGYEVLTML